MTEHAISYETYYDIKDKAQLGLLAEAMIECITKAFGHEMPEDEVISALKGTLIVVAKNEIDAVVGFSTLHRKDVAGYGNPGLEHYSGETVRFALGAGVVNQEYQGQGIYRELNRKRIEQVIQERSSLITTSTQNPRVEHGIAMVLDECIRQGKLELYTISRTISPGRYGRRLTKEPLQTTNTPFEALNIEAGDGFLLIFELTYPKK